MLKMSVKARTNIKETTVKRLYLFLSMMFEEYDESDEMLSRENVGLSLSYGLSLNGMLFWALFTSCFVENRMVSVERIKQFTNIPSESEWFKKDNLPPPNWPDHGSLELKDLYRPNTPLVLKGITLNIQGGQKIGVVGRTGGGKSTLIQVLLGWSNPLEEVLLLMVSTSRLSNFTIFDPDSASFLKNQSFLKARTKITSLYGKGIAEAQQAIVYG
ncbi:ABC transporter C family member 14-like protein [Tanacetum coccineum]|uniref:ABC transporter C family member 14-like protein n=1 Tax=Tanacetum coccineum TaxID=301880 RepID=A0ABQ5FEN9_9ASTR